MNPTHTVTTCDLAPPTITMGEMRLGQIGVVTSLPYQGRVVLCASGGHIVDLSNGALWSSRPTNTNRVRLLPRGTNVTIGVGG